MTSETCHCPDHDLYRSQGKIGLLDVFYFLACFDTFLSFCSGNAITHCTQTFQHSKLLGFKTWLLTNICKQSKNIKLWFGLNSFGSSRIPEGMVEAHPNKLLLKNNQDFSMANPNPLTRAQKTQFRHNPDFLYVFFLPYLKALLYKDRIIFL